MKKIYSFVLMAAMLLIGTNAWAETRHVTEAGQLKTQFAAAQDGDVISVDGIFSVSEQVVLNVNGAVTLELNGNLLQMAYNPSSRDAAILIKQGRLTINNGQIQSSTANTYDLIRLQGTNTNIDAATVTPYSQVIVNANVKLINTVSNVLTICETSSYNFANGARIDVYGELEAEKYGIKVNGTIQIPDPTTNSPYVYIHEGANVHASASASSAVAAYSSGYARWLIEGYCGGSTGLYVKSGEVVLNNAVVTSLNEDATQPVGKGSGVEAGGSAIVIESNKAYSGNISVTIKGNTEVSATAGYAIEETITTALDTEVELIKIEGGVISGGDKGAIIVEDQTAQKPKEGGEPGEKEASGKVVVLGGNISSDSDNGDIVVDQNSNTGAQDEAGPRTLLEIDVANLGGYVELPSTSTATPTVVNVDGNEVIVFVPTTATPEPYAVTLNDDYLATFSAIEKVAIPTGLKAYVAGDMVGNTLDLEEITGVIPAATGVILYNAAKNNKNFSLAQTTDAAPNVASNNLKPAVAWLAAYAGEAYILHGSELYMYNGLKMKDNKAFLMLPGDAPAPARIALHFAETQDVENIEAGVKVEKFFENGQVLIIRGENIYNVQGQIVK